MPLPQGYTLDTNTPKLPPGYTLDKTDTTAPVMPEPEGTFKKVARGATLGAFEGLGVAPAATPGEVVSGTFKQFGQGIKDLFLQTNEANAGVGKKFGPVAQGVASAIDIVPSFIDRTATGLEQGMKEADTAYAARDYETAAEKAASTITSALLLRGGRASEEGLSKVGQLRKAAKEQFQPLMRKVTGVEPAVKEAVGNAAEKQEGALAKHKANSADTIRENLRKQREARTEIDQNKLKTAEENRGIEAGNKEQAAQVAKRGETAKDVDRQSVELGKKIEKVESSVYKEANRKFNKVRAQIGDVEAPPDNLIASVKNVEKNVLQDIPENVKEFRSILSMEGGDADAPLFMDGKEIKPSDPGYEQLRQAYSDEGLAEGKEESKPLTWDKLQSLKSRIDARLRSRSPINGDLKRGLFAVRDSVVDEMGEMAEANGAGESWGDARDFWRQMREDFHEASGPSGSGSPVAQAFNAVDPKNIRQPFLRTQSGVGNRAIDILRKYPEHGGTEAASHAENLIKTHGEMEGLPKKATEKPLKKNPEAIQLPTDKPIPPKPEAPTVDVQKVARDAIATRAKNWGMFNARDIGILASSYIGGVVQHVFMGGGAGLPVAATAFEGGKYAASRLLNKPAVIEWLSKTPKAEIDVINKIPGADKVKIVDGLKDIAVESAKSGKPVTLTPEARKLLGPANVALIMAASGSQVKNRKDALELLRATP